MPRRDIAKTREAFNNLISGKRNPDTPLQSASKRSRSSLSTWRNLPINLDDDDFVEDSEDTNAQMLKKIIKQNSEMNLKLDSLLARQKAIEDRFARMEVGHKDEKDFTKIIVKHVAKNLWTNYIYPTKDEFLQATEAYLTLNHGDYFETLSEQRWISQYEGEIKHELTNKLRSHRGSLTSKVKESLFSVYGEQNLPPINTNSSPTEIYKWKALSSVKKCFDNLFKPINDDIKDSYISRILGKVWNDYNNAPMLHVAFAISVCYTILNPAIEHITIDESIMDLVNKYLRRIEEKKSLESLDSENDNRGRSLSREI